ncbi:MAG: hypothetical protein ACK6DA_02850 [Candidatus Kapaibacterium sp.]|jgi:hypothetical protein
MINARVIFDVNEIEMTRAVKIKVWRILSKIIYPVTVAVGELFTSFVRNTETWQSLTTSGKNDLRAHLGLSNDIVNQGLNDILDTWQKGIKVTLEDRSPSGKDLDMVINIGAIRSDYSDVLNLPLSKYISVNNDRRSKRFGTATEINWLEWLLLEANSITISNWTVEHVDGVRRKNARSGVGGLIMRPSKSKSWTMPAVGKVNFVDNILESAAFQDRVLDIIINKTKVNKL